MGDATGRIRARAIPQARDDARALDLLLDWAPDDATRERILTENPAALYGF